MTDRELIALAAKAAGATHYGGCDDCSPPGLKFHADLVLHYEGAGQFGYVWNPLTDDGDAFRLAVQLGMTIQHEASLGAWFVGAVVGGEFKWLSRNTSTRRAITRAAAEIGRAK